jgi:hypothetical protein
MVIVKEREFQLSLRRVLIVVGRVLIVVDQPGVCRRDEEHYRALDAYGEPGPGGLKLKSHHRGTVAFNHRIVDEKSPEPLRKRGFLAMPKILTFV